MKIITLTCPDCGTVVADNVLERERVLKCPGIDCERELRYQDLPTSDRQYIEDNLHKFRMEDD